MGGAKVHNDGHPPALFPASWATGLLAAGGRGERDGRRAKGQDG